MTCPAKEEIDAYRGLAKRVIVVGGGGGGGEEEENEEEPRDREERGKRVRAR